MHLIVLSQSNQEEGVCWIANNVSFNLSSNCNEFTANTRFQGRCEWIWFVNLQPMSVYVGIMAEFVCFCRMNAINKGIRARDDY